jgi:hypothetical protein
MDAGNLVLLFPLFLFYINHSKDAIWKTKLPVDFYRLVASEKQHLM